MKKGLKALLQSKAKIKADKDARLIGYYDSPDVHSQLQLLALAKGETKSELLRQIVALWLKEHNAVDLAAAQIKSSPEGKDPAFIERLKSFLLKKKVTPTYVDKLLKQLK